MPCRENASIPVTDQLSGPGEQARAAGQVSLRVTDLLRAPAGGRAHQKSQSFSDLGRDSKQWLKWQGFFRTHFFEGRMWCPRDQKHTYPPHLSSRHSGCPCGCQSLPGTRLETRLSACLRFPLATILQQTAKKKVFNSLQVDR